MAINQAARIRNYTPTGFVGGVRAQKLHKATRDEDDQGNSSKLGDEINGIAIERFNAEPFNEGADNGRYKQLCRDQTKHGKHG